jgi:hypothetical protein
MANFQFKDADGKAQSLDVVDKELREETGSRPEEPEDPYCQWFNVLVEMGFAFLMGAADGGFEVDKTTMDAHLARTKERTGYVLPDKHYSIMEKYLAGGKYTFTGWR